MRIETALRGKRVSNALTNEKVSVEVTDEATFKIISALGNNPLRGIKHFVTAKDVWVRLQARYAGKTLIIRLHVLNVYRTSNVEEKNKWRSILQRWKPRFRYWLQ